MRKPSLLVGWALQLRHGGCCLLGKWLNLCSTCQTELSSISTQPISSYAISSWLTDKAGLSQEAGKPLACWEQAGFRVQPNDQAHVKVFHTLRHLPLHTARIPSLVPLFSLHSFVTHPPLPMSLLQFNPFIFHYLHIFVMALLLPY